MVYSRHVEWGVNIDIWDLFILGGTHILCLVCPNHESMPEFPPALNISLGGGGALSFCLCAQNCIFFSVLGKGVYELLQNSMTSKKKRRKKVGPNLCPILPEFCQSIAQICQNFAKYHPNFDTLAILLNLFIIIFFFFFFFFWGGGGAQCPLPSPVSYTYGWKPSTVNMMLKKNACWLWLICICVYIAYFTIWSKYVSLYF